MQKIKTKVLVYCLVLIGLVLGAMVVSGAFIKKTIHYHAGFVVIKNNQKLNFADWKYMNLKPCEQEGKEQESAGDEQLEKAHLHDLIGDVIHVEQEGAMWKDLFINIHYPVDQFKTTAYINGQKVTDYQSRTISELDRLVLFIGDNDISKGLLQAPSRGYIDLMGKKSKTCGD